MANLIIKNEAYKDTASVENVTKYVISGSKTGGCIGGQGVFLNDPAGYMWTVKDYYLQDSGKMVEHFILSFDINEEIDTEDAYWLGYSICGLYPDHQLVFGVHMNTDNLHIHWVMNTVNLRTGKKFNFTYVETFRLRKEIAKILEPYNIPCELRIDNIE